MIFSPTVNALRKPLNGVISRKRMMLQSASGEEMSALLLSAEGATIGRAFKGEL